MHDHKACLENISARLSKTWFVEDSLYKGAVSQTQDFIPHYRNMCPDLSTKTFHLFSNAVPLVSYSVLVVIEKVKASTNVWCLPAELAASPLISPESDLITLPNLIWLQYAFSIHVVLDTVIVLCIWIWTMGVIIN